MDLHYLADAPEDLDISSIFDNWTQVVPTPSPVDIPPSKVVHNFQQDLESLWWILFWVITKRVDHRPSQLYGETIFSHSMESTRARRYALTKRLNLKSVLKDTLSTFAQGMEGMRRALLLHYKLRDGLAKLNNSCSYTTIHDIFQRFFDLLKDEMDSSWASEPLM